MSVMESLHRVETLISGLHHHPRTNNTNRNRVPRSVNIFNAANHVNPRKCQCFDLYDQLVPYNKAWTWQKSLVEEKQILLDRNQDCPDTLILLQHSPVYTMGTGSSEDYLNFNIKDAPFDVYRTERGGEVTYHGPGQLVMYPIINLRNHEMDLHWYLRTLEEVIIRVLSSAFSIKASRLDGLTGVWVGNQKVAAIGIRVSKWITYHGLALNVTTDLAPFNSIVPCGIRDRQVGSIKGLLGDGEEQGKVGDLRLMDVAHESLLKEFSEVFQLQIEKQTLLALYTILRSFKKRHEHAPSLCVKEIKVATSVGPIMLCQGRLKLCFEPYLVRQLHLHMMLDCSEQCMSIINGPFVVHLVSQLGKKTVTRLCNNPRSASVVVLMPPSTPKSHLLSSSLEEDQKFKCYRGVRKRSWGKWVSEIRVPRTGRRILLGSYDAPEKAARAYDSALFCIKGEKGAFNFPNDKKPQLPEGSVRPLSKHDIQTIATDYALSVASAPSSPTTTVPATYQVPSHVPASSDASSANEHYLPVDATAE
ncbi:hypothetical protein IGI04_031433 [Brassica rapa subsp. trilocularis]|uniref:lipoyl(octanoyl) transferase n=1 Tax=Brassica rapa subsp. trilocularis TaxID=1813537 RepID=A0ABQ7LUB0_BRACM|nr:hypothetical protein IGI04_031433 [Brassica rapa subsp. trilocularis]